MAKQLKKWNGRAQGSYRGHFCIAAHSKAEANRLMQKLMKSNISYLNELNVYYSPMWGNDMKDIEPTEPCIYLTKYKPGEPPKRLI